MSESESDCNFNLKQILIIWIITHLSKCFRSREITLSKILQMGLTLTALLLSTLWPIPAPRAYPSSDKKAHSRDRGTLN